MYIGETKLESNKNWAYTLKWVQNSKSTSLENKMRRKKILRSKQEKQEIQKTYAHIRTRACAKHMYGKVKKKKTCIYKGDGRKWSQTIQILRERNIIAL